MGAFGELLIKTWGGDLDHYRGNDNHRGKINDQGDTEEEKIKANDERIKQQKIDSAKFHLDRLTDSLSYRPENIKYITEQSFKASYIKIKTEDWIIDLMWVEYQKYLKK
jgi:hypothetical protein